MASKHPCPNCGAPCYGSQCDKCRNKSDTTPQPGTFEQTTEGDVARLHSISDRITTAEQLLSHANIDLAVWEPSKIVVNKWECPNKDATRQLFQVKVWLRRKIPERVEAALDAVFDRMRKHAPKYTAPRLRPCRDPHMLEFSPFDLHLGQLAWADETGDDWDLDIAERSLARAVEDVLVLAASHPVECFLFPVGSDFFNFDNMLGETVKGTPQDNDGRWAKVFAVGQQACVHAIDAMRERGRVRVVWVGGNHDYTTSWYLCKTLAAWYRKDRRVEVDCAPTPRHYVEYGCNLIGLTHGDEEKHGSLPAIMATEQPDAWARTKHGSREWHVAHVHHKKQVVHTAVDTHDGVVVRVLPSLTGRDAWHAKRGYINADKVAEAYLWSKARGYVGHFSVGKQRR